MEEGRPRKRAGRLLPPPRCSERERRAAVDDPNGVHRSDDNLDTAHLTAVSRLCPNTATLASSTSSVRSFYGAVPLQAPAASSPSSSITTTSATCAARCAASAI